MLLWLHDAPVLKYFTFVILFWPFLYLIVKWDKNSKGQWGKNKSFDWELNAVYYMGKITPLAAADDGWVMKAKIDRLWKIKHNGNLKMIWIENNNGKNIANMDTEYLFSGQKVSLTLRSILRLLDELPRVRLKFGFWPYQCSFRNCCDLVSSASLI